VSNTARTRGKAAPSSESTKPVLVEIDAGTAFITLNRPESLNALNVELMEMLRGSLEDVALNPNVRCVVLRGAGRAFSAGGDVGEIEQRRNAAGQGPSLGAVLDTHSRLMLHHEDSVRLLHTMPKPTLAAVHGHAIGGGLGLALSADIRIVSQTAKLRVGFRQRSLSGDFGMAYFLTHMVGAAKTRELMFLDPIIDGPLAVSIGLATSVHADDDLEAATRALATELATGPSIALGRMKDNILSAETLPLDDALRIEAMNQRVSANTLDATEAGTAFAERRAPRFTGR
jgi:2-(1,2-epoxy-1,2-dihydrophenyl)acetyl-CoA isomerase